MEVIPFSNHTNNELKTQEMPERVPSGKRMVPVPHLGDFDHPNTVQVLYIQREQKLKTTPFPEINVIKELKSNNPSTDEEQLQKSRSFPRKESSGVPGLETESITVCVGNAIVAAAVLYGETGSLETPTLFLQASADQREGKSLPRIPTLQRLEEMWGG